VEQICYYFNQPGGCKKSGEDCKYAHTKLSAEDFAKLDKPGTQAKSGSQAKGGSRASSPAGKGNKRKPTADAKANAKASTPSYCFKFIKESGCNGENCKFMHLDNAAVEEHKETQKVLNEIADRKV